MGDVLSTSIDNVSNLVRQFDDWPANWSPPTAIYSNFNFSSWTLPSFPAQPTTNQGVQVHLLLWNTECLFCDWFKPISTWTFPSTTIAGGRRRRKRSRGERHEPDYDRNVQNIFTYHSLPSTRGVKKGYNQYFYEKPVKNVRKYRHYGGAPIGKRRLESSNIGQKSEDWKNQLVSLNSKLKLINAGLDLLIRLLKYLLQITQK